jgi:hypothetical protein
MAKIHYFLLSRCPAPAEKDHHYNPPQNEECHNYRYASDYFLAFGF